MRVRNCISTLALAAWALAIPLTAQQEPNKPGAPDNTGVNKRDRKRIEATADQAKQNPSDRKLMQQIRKAIVSDKSLSTSAHNVKIIAENGKVTLKGPVRSEDEKRSVEAKAAEVAGPGNIINQLSVKPRNGGKAKAAKTS